MSASGIVMVWLALLVLLAVEVLLSLGQNLGLAVVAVGMAMAVLVAMGFMRLPGAPATAMIFAAASIFWLCVMMGLGVLDPATRQDLPVARHAS